MLDESFSMLGDGDIVGEGIGTLLYFFVGGFYLGGFEGGLAN